MQKTNFKIFYFMLTRRMYKISIIIPMYNESRYIKRCLDSLKNQTYNDFEIILIDDGSKDNTIDIAR
jgi:glycosyltransferase involved in cell wall biosynthesis